jgi:hypothetical protein
LGNEFCSQLQPLILSSQWLYYGQARFDPTQVSALQLAANPQQYQPIPGNNYLNYSAYSSPQMVSGYNIYVYGFLEFDAVEPILMVHGTAADHTSWNDPPPGKLIGTNLGNLGILYPFVAPPAGGSGFFDAAETNYKGAWFSYIDLGGKSFGNDSIENSAVGPGGLKDQIPAILNALGTRSCHLIAHSKGGSDCRFFISDSKFIGNQLLMNANDFDIDKLQIKYKILSLYTIGTPNWGTPISDIEQAIVSNGIGLMGSTIGSSDPNVSSTANQSILVGFASTFTNHVPQGLALLDQQTSSQTLSQSNLNSLKSVNSINTILNEHLYSIIGDADLDRSGDITGGEGTVLFPPYEPNILLDHVWNTVGRVGSVSINTIAQFNDMQFGKISYIDIIPYYLSPSVEPNDLVTPIWSAIAPSAKILQVPWPSPFFAVSGSSPSLLQGGYGTIYYSNILSPGNHSLVKNSTAAITIINQIIIDYPINNP